MGDHIETLQVDFDPSIVSYEELMNLFWSSHDPTRQMFSRQYMSALFYHDDTQKGLALAAVEKLAEEYGQPIVTEILPAEPFYIAEDYHQKFYLQARSDVMAILDTVFPDFAAFNDSTLAARLNGYFGRYPNVPGIHEAIRQLDLPDEVADELMSLF